MPFQNLPHPGRPGRSFFVIGPFGFTREERVNGVGCRRTLAGIAMIGMEATKLPADVSSKVYDAETAMFFTNGHFDPKDVAAVEHALIESGQLDTMPNTSKYLTEEFLK